MQNIIKRYRHSKESYIVMTVFCGLMFLNTLINDDLTYNQQLIMGFIYGALTILFYNFYRLKKEEMK